MNTALLSSPLLVPCVGMPAFCYSVGQLLALRPSQSPCVPRATTRRLKYFRIYVWHIPVVKSRREPQRSLRKRPNPRVRCLRKYGKTGRSSGRLPRPPSLLYSNVRSISNKVDEVSLRIREHSPPIFYETWLSDEIPDVAVNVEGYNILRKDRDKHGGGIILFHRDFIIINNIKAIDESHVPSLTTCET